MHDEKLQESIELLRTYYSRIDGVVLFLILILLILLACVWTLGSSAAPLLVALACALTGGLLGFLFAVPKRVRTVAPIAPLAAGTGAGAASTNASPEGAVVLANYESNTSLEEISDWLTKIIVGVGLVEAQSIAAAIGRAGRAVGIGTFGLPPGGAAGEVLGVATIVAFAVLGFLISFLWFRQNLMIAWSESHPEQRSVSKKKLQSASPELVQSTTPPPTPGEMPDDINLDAISTGASGSGGDLAMRINEKYLELRTRPRDPEDWAKGMFGGAAATSNPRRTLSAKVRPVRNEDHFEVTLTVTSHPPAQGDVAFFLHNTFTQTTQIVSCDRTGTAELTIYAWGAFTVGVLMDDGRTQLELDLSEIPDAPAEFLEQ